MSNISVDYDVLNQKQTPAFYASSLATRPAFGYPGRIFIDTDSPSSGIYRDTGSAWVQVADPGAGTTGTLQQVTTNGNTTTLAIQVQGIDISKGAGTGASSTAVGTSALSANTTGYINVAVGTSSLAANTTGYSNTAIGTSSLAANTTGYSNTGVGQGTLLANTTGSNNIALGQAALLSNSTGTQNIAIGVAALNNNTTGYNNIAIGYVSLTSNTTGSANTALGLQSLTSNTTGANNTAIGGGALVSNTTGSNNTTIGNSSGSAITTGNYNTIIGNYAGTTTLTSNIVLSDGAGNVRLFADANGLIAINQAVGSVPGGQIDIHTAQTYALVLNGLTTNNAYTAFSNNNVGKWRIGNTYNAGANTFDVYNFGTSSNAISINSTSNNVNFGGTIGNGTYTYTLPSATGTLALTSALSSYLPLTGGTLTGALNINVASGTGINSTGDAIFRGNTGIGTPRQLLISSSGSTPVYLDAKGYGANYGTDLGLRTFDASGNSFNVFYGTSNGNAIIGGVTDAGYRLDVVGTGRFNGTLDVLVAAQTIASFNTSSASGGWINFKYNTTTSFGYIGTGNQISTGAAVTDFAFANDAGNIVFATGSFVERMRITSSGNVGIGNVGPSVLLSVGASQTSPSAVVDLTLGLNRYLMFGTSGSGAAAVRSWGISNNESVAGDFAIKSSSTNNNTLDTVRFQITNAGVVTIAALGTGTVTATSGTLSTVSDMNLKIEDGFIDNALDKVMNLKPRYFYWKEESGLPTNLRQLGFYAQEVNSALGEEAANTPKNKKENWGIYDRGIIAMLTKSIQELNEKLIKININ